MLGKCIVGIPWDVNRTSLISGWFNSCHTGLRLFYPGWCYSWNAVKIEPGTQGTVLYTAFKACLLPFNGKVIPLLFLPGGTNTSLALFALLSTVVISDANCFGFNSGPLLAPTLKYNEWSHLKWTIVFILCWWTRKDWKNRSPTTINKTTRNITLTCTGTVETCPLQIGRKKIVRWVVKKRLNYKWRHLKKVFGSGMTRKNKLR